MTLKLSIPLRTGRGLNDRMHLMVRARKVKAERLAVGLVLNTHKAPAGPVTVNLGRVSPSAKGLDKDNLQGALKGVRDQVSAWLGRDDADESITWNYSQKPGKRGEWAVEIEVMA